MDSTNMNLVAVVAAFAEMDEHEAAAMLQDGTLRGRALVAASMSDIVFADRGPLPARDDEAGWAGRDVLDDFHSSVRRDVLARSARNADERTAKLDVLEADRDAILLAPATADLDELRFRIDAAITLFEEAASILHFVSADIEAGRAPDFRINEEAAQCL